jgi:hypothetical protein
MRKRIKVIPPRDERMEKIGDPKTPKMGKITPKSIELPPVDGLLDKMRKATAPVRIKFLPPENGYPPMLFDLGSKDRDAHHGGGCSIKCRCLPCLDGNCDSCYVDAQRYNPDKDVVRALVAQYRNDLL